MQLWMVVSDDKYELPLIVETSCEMLARKLGVLPNAIYRGARRPDSKYKRVIIKETDDEDET